MAAYERNICEEGKMILLRNNSVDDVHLCGHINECILCEELWFSGITSEPTCPPRSLLT